MKTLSFIRIILVLVVVGLVGCSAPSLAPTAGSRSIADTGALRQVVEMGHSGIINKVAFSPDGRFALSGSDDSTMILWEVATGRKLRTFTGHYNNVNSVAFSPDGRFALSGSEDRTMKLWEVATGRELHIFTEHSWSVSSVAFSPDGRFALSGNGSTMKLWEVATGRELRTFTTSHPSSIDSVDFSPDGRFALSGSFSSFNSTMKLWEVATGRELRTFTVHSNIYSVAFSPDGRFALSGSDDNTVKLWEVATGKQLRSFTGHSHFVGSVAFSPDGSFALSGSGDNTMKLWEVATGRELRTFGNLGSVKSVAFSPDGSFVLSGIGLGQGGGIGDVNNTINLWEVATGRELRIFTGHSGSINSVAFSPDGRFALSGSGSSRGGVNNTMKLWEVATGRELRTFTGHYNYVNSVAFSPDGRFALSGSGSGGFGTTTLWEVTTGRELRSLPVDTRSVAFSPDGRFALSSNSGFIKLWEVATGRELRTFVHFFLVESVAFSPDGRFALSGSWDNHMKLWEVATGRELRTFSGHSDHVTSVAFSPDGRFALSGSLDNTMKLWEVATGRELRTFTGHYNNVNSVAFSPDGRFALSGSEDQTMKLWEVASGREIANMISTTDGEWSIHTPDGYYNTSPEGKSAVHYASDTETYSFEQFESLFRRPDIIKARLAGDLTAGTPAPKLTRPPRVTADPTRSIQTTTDQATYPLAITATSQDDVVKTVRVFVNGKPALEQPVDAKEQHLNFTVPLFAGPNRITTVAYDSKGFSSNQESIDIVSTVPGAKKPTLFVMAAGVSVYPNMPAADQLEYAHSDANALVQTLRNQKGKLFQDVRDLTLVNQEVTLQQLEAGLTALSAMDTNDIAIIFLAGHGVQGKDGKFWYVTPQGSMEHPEHGGLDWQILVDHISRIKGRVILFLDACHSGSIVDETIVPNDQLAAKFFQGGMGGVMVFSASKGRQTSREHSDFGGGHGAFTYAIIQALGEKAIEADKDNNGFVEFMELVDYVSTTVNTLIRGGKQTPWLSRKELFGDLAIAMVKKGG